MIKLSLKELSKKVQGKIDFSRLDISELQFNIEKKRCSIEYKIRIFEYCSARRENLFALSLIYGESEFFTALQDFLILEKSMENNND